MKNFLKRDEKIRRKRFVAVAREERFGNKISSKEGKENIHGDKRAVRAYLCAFFAAFDVAALKPFIFIQLKK